MATKLNDIEVAFRLKGEQGLRALDQIVDKSQKAQRSFEGFAESARGIGLGFAAVGAAITATLGLAVRGAEQEAEALRQLQGTVEATGDSFAARRGQIDSFVAGLAKATKFTDDEIIPALNRAVIATGNLDDGFRAAELGTKLAAAGFGSLEANAALVARLLEGQVGAIGRVIPEFRDLEERLEAGATESELAAEALLRLQNVADNIQAPSGIQQFNKAIGELNDAVGAAVITALGPLVVKLTESIEAFTRFAESGPGKVTVALVAFSGIILTVAGSLAFFIAQFAIAVPAITAFSARIGLATTATRIFGTTLTFLSGPIGIILALGTAVAGLAVHFNNLSRAADEARDKTFQSDRLTQFTAELKELQKTIVAFNSGLISAGEAEKVFHKFGVANREEAGKRSEALVGIIARLEEEKKAAAEASNADTNLATAKQDNIEATIAKLQKEKEERIALDLAQEEFLRRELERGKKLAGQVVSATPELPPQEGFGGQGLGQEEPATPLPDFQAITTDIKLFEEGAGALEERLNALAEAEQRAASGGVDMTASFDLAAEQAARFEAQLIGLVAGAIDGLATLGANFAVDMIDSFDQAGKNAQRFFANLGKQIVGAIAKALILNAILGSIGGVNVGFGKKLSDLFQDPRADQLARFEGQRFVDLFFQGVTREMGNARDRMDSSLTDNRDLTENRGKPTSIIVTEASPETTVEFTDRKVEPRVRQRARQRTGNVDTPFGSTA